MSNINTQNLNQIVDEKVTNVYKSQEKRDYIGVSGLGDECGRRIQYSYLQADGKCTAKQIRTFDIGHALEDLVAQWMAEAGFYLKTRDLHGGQFAFSTADGKIAGHADGIITGCSDDLKEALQFDEKDFSILWECKTMNDKNWNETKKHGVFASKFIYYVQVQIYMAYLDLNHCLFTALNKNTSELYIEIIDFDKYVAQTFSDRGVRILKAIENNELLPRLAKDSTFFKCKACLFYETCWKGKPEEKQDKQEEPQKSQQPQSPQAASWNLRIVAVKSSR